MSLWQTLTEKSWLDTGLPAPSQVSWLEHDYTSKQIALGLFLAIVTVIFSLFAVTFLSHSQYPGFEALSGQPWRPLENSSRLWFNTGLLFLSSLLMHLAVWAQGSSRPYYALAGLLMAGFFALQFLVAQWLLWQQMSDMGYGLRSNPASSYFFLFTGVHGLHLMGGVVVLIRPLNAIWRRANASAILGSIKLCAIYWHYLLAVWLLLFLLLTRSPETYRYLAALCGLEA